ncbi:MAG: hypothetical protein ACRD88_13720 [Terriglobia bacterium]
MSGAPFGEAVFMGWDVGGWNCDKNNESRDAIVILDAALHIVGEPWRGNLRASIGDAATTSDWIRTLFSLCAATPPDQPFHVTMAIDTPLGFPREFVRLITDRKWTDPPGSSHTNAYLFRQTERHLFQTGRTPLSAIKDMIGSQATKGIHVLAKFAPVVESCGVWTDGGKLSAIETYPTACGDADKMKSLLRDRQPLKDADRQDALICALVGYLFATHPETLEPPGANVPEGEGWIWVPRDTHESEYA